MVHSGVLYIFERRQASKRRGARSNLSPTPLSTGLLRIGAKAAKAEPQNAGVQTCS